MEFLITSRRVIPLVSRDTMKKHIIISICEPTKDFADISENQNRLDLLRLKFTDEDNHNQYNVGKLITVDHAKEILDLVWKWQEELKLIICQCDGGISRSSATAAALSKILDNDDNWVFRDNRYVPNMLVYRTILSTWQDFYQEDDIEHSEYVKKI